MSASPAASLARAAFDRALDRVGSTITVQRAGVSDLVVKGYPTDLSPEDLVGDIAQSDRKIILGYKELVTASWPLPMKKGDRVVLDGRTYTVQTVTQYYVSDMLVKVTIIVRG